MVFTSSVFKKVLSVFITAAVLKLGQGLYNFFFSLQHRKTVLLFIMLDAIFVDGSAEVFSK